MLISVSLSTHSHIQVESGLGRGVGVYRKTSINVSINILLAPLHPEKMKSIRIITSLHVTHSAGAVEGIESTVRCPVERPAHLYFQLTSQLVILKGWEVVIYKIATSGVPVFISLVERK